jgi:signal transduction histidine kinase
MDLSMCDVRLGERRLFTGFVRDISRRRELEHVAEATGEQERARIARELHDGPGQQRGGLLFMMDGLHRDLRAAEMQQAETAAQLGKELSTASNQTRNLAHELYSVAPTAEGFVEALENLAERVTTERRIACEFVSKPVVLIHDPTLASHQAGWTGETDLNNSRGAEGE